MKQFFNQVSVLFARLRPFAIAATCAFVLFVNATPAFAFGGSSSQPSKGTEQLNSVQKMSEDAITKGGKNDMGSMRNVSKNSERGLNEVQGAADKEDMISTNSANGETIEGRIEDVLEDITP
ncbi:MAG: hypothetical protein WBG63_06940 [Phormidesmis sp.]